ncbi:MAG: hypothetical protein UR27_C0007G0014 [Candidatus Peregrinibacteria bacterium GW2011_GWA2_33_10]|nr:MAG: hypothetical protein UR27_C0007G0014 [Candidatus Peregrinibacteria bacterium GW2011_GWA2_33_10]KKP40925.1 MAG: hypothetical protein UR30_C0003G0097 [Candidatus Peregrinibacteria bacterium GW2011_GWC2_33_13]
MAEKLGSKFVEGFSENDNSRGLKRRDFLIHGGVVSLLSCLGIYKILPFLVNSENKEFIIKNLISEVESGISSLAELVFPNLEQYIEDPKMIYGIHEIFNLFGKNKDNELRNIETVKRKGSTDTKIRDSNFFSYGILKDFNKSETKPIGLYSPYYNVMALHENFDGQNIIDLIIAFHEGVHVLWDREYRNEVQKKYQFSDATYRQDYDKYVFLFGTEVQSNRVRIFLPNEAYAYAAELELINVLLKGKLNDMVKKGETLNYDFFCDQLNISVGVGDEIKKMFYNRTKFLAEEYFKLRNEKNPYFKMDIISLYENCEIYDDSENGGLVRVK